MSFQECYVRDVSLVEMIRGELHHILARIVTNVLARILEVWSLIIEYLEHGTKGRLIVIDMIPNKLD